MPSAADAPGPQPAPPSLPVVFRPARTRKVLISAGTVLLVLLSAIGLALRGLGPGERFSFILTGLLGLGVLLLLSRPRVVADGTGVTVTNLTTTRHLEWAEILRVNLRPGDAWVHLDLADGTSMPAMGIQPGIAKEQALADARALRELTAKHGTGAPGA